MMLIAALALAAWDTQLAPQNTVSCDLAPFIGGGSSSAGRLDSLDGIGLGCGFAVYAKGRWTLGPRLDLSEQRWSVFKSAGDTTFFNSYQARSLGLGFDTRYKLNETWELGYTLSFGLGQGQQDQNISTPTSTQNLHLGAMTQKSLRHELLLFRRYSPRLAFLAGAQWETARQSWDAEGRLEQENVAPGNKLTLTNGTGADLDTPIDPRSSYHAVSFKVGVQMLIYSGTASE